MLYLKIYWFLQSCQGHFALDFEEDFSKLLHRFCHSPPPHTQPHPPLEKQPFNIVAVQALCYDHLISWGTLMIISEDTFSWLISGPRRHLYLLLLFLLSSMI